MSDWGERAHRAAEALDMEAIEATDPEDVQYGFREGAHWQREALLSDEAVLRALNAEEPRAATDNLADWGEGSITRMRAALAAALGEEGSNE